MPRAEADESLTDESLTDESLKNEYLTDELYNSETQIKKRCKNESLLIFSWFLAVGLGFYFGAFVYQIGDCCVCDVCDGS